MSREWENKYEKLERKSALVANVNSPVGEVISLQVFSGSGETFSGKHTSM
jgi:hypothetical protein